MTDARKRAVRISAGRLLLEERKTAKEVRLAVEEVAAHAAAQARQERIQKAAIFAVLLGASRRMSARVASALEQGRARARQASAERLSAELRAQGHLVQINVQAVVREVDAAHAASSADALAARWQTQALHGVIKAKRRGTSAAEAIEAAADGLAGSIHRTAATETAQAYDDGRTDAVAGPYRTPGERAEYDEDDAAADAERILGVPGYVLIDHWDAILDSRTCPHCAALDGTSTYAGQPFPSREEPGFVHPMCRCIRTTEAIPRQAVEAA